MNERMLESFKRLNNYLNSVPIEGRFKGYDPFDGLNSPVVSQSILGRSRVIRLLWIQFFKRSSFNLRKLAFIKPGYNPQALGLFLSTYSILYKKFERQEDLDAIKYLLDKIMASRIDGYSGACWGYNFDWQARAFYQPANTPMIVPTAAVFNGLLDAHDVLTSTEVLDIALSTQEFVVNDLNRNYENETFVFSYSPLDNSIVYNASLMASKILARIYNSTKNQELLPVIEASVNYCVKHQHDDGHWTYGAKPYHQWIDNFHTGYNLECIADVSKFIGTTQYQETLDRGFDYYISTFFDERGRSKYHATKTYPVDINNPAQLLITLSTFNKKDEYKKLADRVLAWTINKMQDKTGYFYYRHYSSFRNKINYVRWSQAWMFYSMAKYLFEEDE